jgi:hypothetical protein
VSPDPADKPEVVDLRRYRQAVDEQAKAEAKAKARPVRRPAKPEALLGGRKHAGLIVAALVLAMLALWLAPKLL